MAKRIPAPPRIANLRQTGAVELKGLREYQDKLIALGDGMVNKGCVVGLAAGANLMRDAVRSRTAVLARPDPRRKPGTLRNAIHAMHVAPGKYAVTFVIGIKLLTSRAIGAFKRRTGRSAQENPDDPFYGVIREFGKLPRTRHPVLLPGFQASAEPAVKLAHERLRDFTDPEIRRLGAQR